MNFAPPWRRSVPWLLGLAATALLIGWAGQQAARREADARADGIHRAIELHALALRGATARYNYLPFTAAQQPDVLAALAHPQDPAYIAGANRYLEEVNARAGTDALYVMDARGLTLAASNWNNAQSFVGQDYTDRPYFIDARAGRSGLFYAVGKTTGIPGLFISAPVRVGGAVVGVMVVKVSLREIQQAWRDGRDPILLADERGVLFLGSEESWMYNATRPLSPEGLEWIRAHKQYGLDRTFPAVPWTTSRANAPTGYLVSTRLAGASRHFLAIDEHLPELGWTLTVMTDYAPVTGARITTWTLGTLGAGVLLLGGLYLRLHLRRLAEQVQARAELERRVVARTAELQEAHRFRKAMEDALLVGMRARDLDGRIIYVNPALCDMTGYATDELVGCLPPYPYWHPQDLDRHWRDSDAAMNGRAAITGFESRILHRAGHEVFTMVYTAALVDAGGKHCGWMSSVVDVTEQKRTEALLRSRDGQLQRSLRLSSLGELASSLGHELNQPLMALGSFASAAKAFAQQGQRGLLIENLEAIQTQAHRAGDIVARIREQIRRRAEGIEPGAGIAACAINTLVATVLDFQKAEIRLRQARVETRLESGLPAIAGDRVQLEQVLVNLVQNSLQAMQETPVARRLVEIDTSMADAMVCVRISDRGTGVAPDAASQLFEPLYTTKPDGLGLGLAICRTIVESHRGRLAFENRADGGATFTLYLPCQP